jgi:threonine 3-dehydrogenase
MQQIEDKSLKSGGIRESSLETYFLLALVKEKRARGAILKEVKEPELASNHVLAKVRATSICGTDVHIYEWNNWAASLAKPPKIMGHEFAAEVVEVGDNVAHLKKGDLISGETHIYCGYCHQCRLANFHLCQNVKLRGVDMDGCFAEYVLVSENTAWKNDPSISPFVASAQEPLGNAVHCVFAGDVTGNSVVIFGCGPIGLCAIELCKSAGASEVFAVDVSEYRLDLALKMGADQVIDGRTTDVVSTISSSLPDGADVVLEMSGAPIALDQALKVARRAGRVTLLGLPSDRVTIDVSNDLILKGLNVQGIFGRKIFSTWDLASRLLKGRQVDLNKIITHKLKMEEFERAFDLMAEGRCGKIVLTF